MKMKLREYEEMERKLRENEEMKMKLREYEEMERILRENEEMERDSLTFPHSLFISSLPIHFLYQNLSYFVTNVTKKPSIGALRKEF